MIRLTCKSNALCQAGGSHMLASLQFAAERNRTRSIKSIDYERSFLEQGSILPPPRNKGEIAVLCITHYTRF